MILKRKRYSLPTSKGYAAFRTKRSDLQEFAPQYRLEMECGRPDNIASHLFPQYTMVNAQGGYMPCADYWYTEQAKIDANNARWSNDFEIREDIEAWTRHSILKTRKVAKHFKKRGLDFNANYVLIYFENGSMSKQDIVDKAQMLMVDRCRKLGMPLYNYALIEGRGEKWFLFARKKWLKTFYEGMILMGIYTRMKPNFQKIYGFELEKLISES